MTGPRLSVIITNYNYGRFLQDAIDSALAQTYPDVEVVVVDDGSTDHSRDVIAAAAGRVVPVLKANGGQASAFNAGFAHCTGDVVLLLDADDMLLPATGERVVAALAAQPDAAKVHYRLEVVDVTGAPTGDLKPPRPLSSGDLRRRVLEYYEHNWPPTSGNAFPRRVLERLLPMPEERYRISADCYLANMAALLGPMIALPEPGARYRRHGANHFDHLVHAAEKRLDERLAARARDITVRVRATRTHQRHLARELGLPLPPPERDRWRRDALQRLISLKLDPARHPVPGDTLWRVARGGVATSLVRAHNPAAKWPERLLQAGWFVTVAAAPRRVAGALIRKYYFPDARGPLAQFILDLRHRRFRHTARSPEPRAHTALMTLGRKAHGVHRRARGYLGDPPSDRWSSRRVWEIIKQPVRRGREEPSEVTAGVGRHEQLREGLGESLTNPSQPT